MFLCSYLTVTKEHFILRREEDDAVMAKKEAKQMAAILGWVQRRWNEVLEPW
ncbi:hypothetical protein KSB_90770 [Ktedonobacter robiniae]|uniref:Transposase n=1 Tax=Ktedonobacter robiniae TaxID=2778365 RepID=A0ABQ3V752_9CHLR|nr:hypothetical protein KSB_90770 [Ktedonobacter robiniae]